MCWQRPAAASRETAYQPHLLKGNGCRKARGHKSDHLWRGLGHREHMLGADHSPLCTGMAAPGGRQHKCTHTAGQQQKHALAAGPASSRLGQARQAGRAVASKSLPHLQTRHTSLWPPAGRAQCPARQGRPPPPRPPPQSPPRTEAWLAQSWYCQSTCTRRRQGRARQGKAATMG